MVWPTKKLEEITIGIIIVIFTIAFFVKKQYSYSLTSLALLVLLLKIDSLKKFTLGPKSGLEAEFQIPEENIKKDIEENNEPITKETFAHFRKVEEKVLNDIQKKLNGEMKKKIHFVYGAPDRPEFTYTPDATIQTEKEIIFLEIKYVLRPEFVEKIVKNTIRYLKTVLDKFSPMAGKKLKAKLILASEHDLNLEMFSVPGGIELEFYKL